MSWATMFASVASAWNKADLLLKAQYVATAITLAVGVKGFMEAKALMAKGQDILGQKTSQGGKIPVIYGRRRVGSTVVFMNTANNRSKDLLVVYALSVGEIDQIELDTIEINGVSIKDPIVFRQGYYAGSDKIASGAGSLCTFDQRGTVTAENAGGSGTDPAQRYRMVFNAHHGADDQAADPMLVASSGGQWTSSHRVRGIAYLACSYEYDTKGMFSSIPQLTVVCRGKKLYDPRKDGSITGGTGSHRYNTPSTFEWSDNAALCLLDYMRDNQYGKGLAETDINLQTFQSTATTAETKQDTPDYDGSYAASTFSGDAGTGVIIVDEDTWKTAKIGANLNLKDNAGNVEFVDNQIVDATRYQPFDENAIYQVIVRNALANTYTNEAGQALVKVERFSCNGVIDANKNILENTQELLANMRGILNYIDGKYEITLEDTASSTFTVTDDHIIGDSGITVTYEDKAQKANKVVVQFFNALKKYEMDTATVLHDASPNFTSDDGGEELELVIEFPHIVNKYVAYNMGKAILGRSRSQMTIAFTGTPELYKTKVGDVITVVYTPVGFTGKLFRIESMTLQPDGLVGVQAIEYLDIYTWQAPPQEIIEPINNPVAYFAVKAPTGITFTDAGSSSTGRSFLTWNEPTDYPNHQYRIRIVDSSSNKLTNKIVDQEFVDLNYLPVGSNYVASVSAINSINEESSAATLTFSVSTPPVATADIKNSAISTSKIIAHAISLLNPMSATGNVYRYGGYNDIGTVVNAIPSGIALSYNSAENALSIVSDANTSISSDSFEVDHNSIYKLSFQIKKTTTGGDWYVGAKQFTSFTSGNSSDGGNNQSSLDFGVYGSNRTAGTDTPNAYFASKTVTDTNYSEVVCYLIGSQVNLDEVPNHSYSAGVGGYPYIRLDSTATQAGIRILNWSNDTTTRTVLVKNLTMAQMTANTIVAENISVTNLAAINADLGNITAGSLDINSAFTVSSAGAMTATGAVISGAITATSGSFTGSLNSASGTFTGALSGGTISIGSGNSIFKADANGIYLGHATFASAPFSVTPAGALSAQSATLSGTIKSNQSFTSGSSTRTVKIDASTNSTYTLTAGADNPTNAPFRIKSDGTVEITKLKLYLDDGVTEIFDSATGFTVNAFSGIVQDLGASIQSYSKTISSNTDAQKITLTASQSITVKAIKSAQMFGWSTTSPFDALGQIPSNVRMRLMHSTNANLSSPTELAVLGSTWTGGVSRIATGTPTNIEYEVFPTLESEPGFTFYEYETLNQSGDAIANDFTFTISNTATYTGSTNGTDHYFFIEVAGTGGTSLGANDISATATRSLNISGTSFYISNGTASNIGEGDITAVYAGTNLSGGGTAGAVTLNLNSTISGDHTFSNNVVIGGNLDVQGTTTTIDTTNLDVKDKNITLNYGTGDTSALSDGAGITIQDAVNSTTNATILWDKPNSRFTTSHGLNVGGVLTIPSTATFEIDITGTNAGNIRANSDLYILSQTGTLRLGAGGTNSQLVLATNGNATFTGTISSGAITSTGTISSNAVGIGTATVDSGYLLHLKSTGDAAILIEADTDNVTETDNAFIRFKQDGGAVAARVGYADNVFEIMNEYNDSLILGQANTPRLTLTSASATFAGTISSGAITSTGHIQSAGALKVTETSTAQVIMIGNQDGGGANKPAMIMGVNGIIRIGHGSSWSSEGGTFSEKIAISNNDLKITSGGLILNATTVIDASRNITAGTISSTGTSNFGNFQLTDSSRLGFGTVKAGATVGHTASVDEGIFWHTGNEYGIYRTAGVWTPPYPILKIRFDTGVEIDGGTAGTYSDINFSRSNLKIGGTQFLDQSRNLTNIGNIKTTADNSYLSMGVAGLGTSVGARYLSIEGNTDTSGEGSGRIFFTEHNSTTAAMDNYGMSLGYRGGDTSIVGASGNTWTGLTQIGNGQWGMWGHDNNATGALIMSGDRAATFIDFHSNNFSSVGTISSANISATGTGTTPFTFTGTSTSLVLKIGSATQSEYASTLWETNDGLGQIWKTGSAYTAWGGADALNIYNSNGNISFHPSNTQSVLQLTSTAINATKPIQISGTTVIDASRNLTNIGTISSGAITSSGQIHLTGSSSIRSNSPIAFNAITGAAQSGLFKSVAAQTSYANSASDGMFNALNGYAVGTGTGQTVIDASRNITAGTISSGAITSSGTLIASQLRAGDGTDGYFYSDSGGRTAFAGGSFYIQNSVTTYYNYATTQYHGNTSGNSLLFRGNVLSGNSWAIDASGNITAGTISSGAITSTGTTSLSSGKVIIDTLPRGLAINYADSSAWVLATSGFTTQTGYYGGNFAINGSQAENQVIHSTLPDGTRGLVWHTPSNDASNDADGGWNKTITGITDNNSYMSVVYVRRNGTGTNGTFYHGCDSGHTLNLNGTANTNPYFNVFGISALPQDVWCISIAFIRANSETSTSNSGIGGTYRLDTGEQINSSTDFKMKSGSTQQVHRTYLYYSTQTTASLSWAKPMFYVIDGSEPTLNSLIKKSSTASSPQGTTSPFNATNNTLTFLLNVSHLNGLVTGSQTGVLDLSTGELEINTQGEINIKANSITAAKILANTITANKINVTDLALNFDAATVSGATIGAWQSNTMRLKLVADLGTAAGVYHIFCRVFGSTGQVKTLSVVAGDGTFGSGASFELRSDISYTDGAAPTLVTQDQGYTQYHSGQSQYWSAIDRFDSSYDMVQKDFMVRKVSNTSRTLRLYILAQGDGSNRYLTNVQFGVYRFTEI